jgi:hypothetical protein
VVVFPVAPGIVKFYISYKLDKKERNSYIPELAVAAMN